MRRLTAKIKFGIRFKLLILSLILFSIPWLGYQFVWELESYLRHGQEQTMVGTARAIATALHERPSLFDNNAAYLSDVRPGTDLYAHPIIEPIHLDGQLDDWATHRHLMLHYGAEQLLGSSTDYHATSLNFAHMVGRYKQYLYAMFKITDDKLVLRAANSLRVDRNDHLQIALLDQNGLFKRYIVAATEPGWVNAYLLENSPNSLRPIQPEVKIQGHWKVTKQGYNIELRFPLAMLSGSIAFAIADVDDEQKRTLKYAIGTADPKDSDSLGTVLVPSPQIEKILKGLKYANSRVWVVDKHQRVLARAGDILNATGIQTTNAQQQASHWWSQFEQHWLLPLYYQILTRPPKDFIDELDHAYALKDHEIGNALQGSPSSQWRLSPDNKAVILSAAHPIYIDEQVMGAVVVEQTTHGIRTLRNRALERLFHIILAVMSLGTLALFLFASRISTRIRRLRDQTEAAIDSNGKIVAPITASTSGDEIGDLSRTFHSVLGKLGQYNAYLENMASRLSHELRTPVAIVNSSLENLALENPEQQQNPYILRAKQGIQRLSKILTSMSEATRLEQALAHTEPEPFNLNELVDGCVEGYKIAYQQRHFSIEQTSKTIQLIGSAELFAQMLDKVVTNAVEFSWEGSEIRFKLWHKQDSAYISLINSGATLPEDMQNQLFDSMVSIRQKQCNEQTHLGLGLYVAKMIAGYHGGTISISDLPDNNGVCVKFIFTINS